MFAYKTNSSDYLDYIASVYTREQIKANPDLCLLLENEYIKDNTELALRWHEAKYGVYQDKYSFVEFFLCNGPELDADTILHYRELCAFDPVCMEIAYSYLSDNSKLQQIRRDVYNKETDDCFQNPCFYLGPFSNVMGSTGDIANTLSPFNQIANWIEGNTTNEARVRAKNKRDLAAGLITQAEADARLAEAIAKDAAERAKQQATPNTGTPGSQTVVDSTNVTDGETPDKTQSVGGSRSCFSTVIIPAVERGWKMMMKQITEGGCEFSKELMSNANCITNAEKLGDKLSTPIAEMLDLVTKANVRRQLGDCGRVWSQLRRMRLFGPDNSYQPVTANQTHPEIGTDGSPNNPVSRPNPTVSEALVTQPTKTEQPSSSSDSKENDSHITTDEELWKLIEEDNWVTIDGKRYHKGEITAPLDEYGIPLWL